MRVISQDGNIDYNYDNVFFELDIADDNYNILCFAGDRRMPISIAKYSTEEKAKRAMEMLHNAYVGIIKGLNVQMPEGADKILKEMSKTGYGMLIAVENYDRDRIEFYPMNTVFQFPADEEFE